MTMTGRSADAADLLQPHQLLGGEPTGGGRRDHGVHQREADTGEIDHAITRVDVLTPVRVVVAPDHLETIPERLPIAGFERRELLIHPVRGEIALGHDRGRVERGDLGRGTPVHRLGICRLPRADPLDGTERAVTDPTRLDLAEVDVVHRGEPAQQLAAGAGQRADGHTLELVRGVGLEAVEAQDTRAVVQHDEVLGDGGDVHGADGSGRRADSRLGRLIPQDDQLEQSRQRPRSEARSAPPVGLCPHPGLAESGAGLSTRGEAGGRRSDAPTIDH